MPTNAVLKYPQLSDVPEALREHAAEKDGTFTVSVVLAEDLKGYRDNNVNLLKERDAMTSTITRYEQVTGVPMDTLEEGSLEDFAKVLDDLKNTKARVDDGKLVENTSLEEAAARRVTEVTQDLRGQIDAVTKDRDAHKEARVSSERRMNEMMVENMIRAAAADSEVAMFDKAVNMVLPQALRVFKVEDDGKIVPKEVDGTTMYGNDGMNPLSAKEWLLKQREETDFLFRGARGGDAAGGSDTSGGKMAWGDMQKLRPEERMRLAREGKA